MNLKEFEGKEIFKEFGINVPKSFLAGSCLEAQKKGRELLGLNKEGALVLKAQILSGKRGKNGGILFAKENEILEKAKQILGSEINNFKVSELLVEEKSNISKEYYFSITVNREQKSYTVIFSEQGGMDIEEIAESHPDKILKFDINPNKINLKELEKFFTENSTLSLELISQLIKIAEKAAAIICAYDATLVEINPLALNNENKLMALDAKIVIDDNAAFRQPKFNKNVNAGKTELEAESALLDISYVELDGDIAVIGNGAGLTMATLDLINFYGGQPANFLDIGGGADNEVMAKALGIALAKKGIKAIFINIFGGITRCDEAAKGIINYIKEKNIDIKMVVRLSGTFEKEGINILNDNGIKAYNNMEEAAANVV